MAKFPYLTSGSRCITEGNAPHVRKTAMANHILYDNNNNFIFRYHQCTELDKLRLFRPNLPRRVSSQTPHFQFSQLLAIFDTQQDDLISEVHYFQRREQVPT
ncbi:unnamed protein product [Clavelina lepadiformis]|uniref:Uncharacterized protein n=1 Tax=Clavelina lepadiformis TaxID=159417 RepID=A0ABP0G1C4_CLALP